jgi:hypothetical protein
VVVCDARKKRRVADNICGEVGLPNIAINAHLFLFKENSCPQVVFMKKLREDETERYMMWTSKRS